MGVLPWDNQLGLLQQYVDSESVRAQDVNGTNDVLNLNADGTANANSVASSNASGGPLHWWQRPLFHGLLLLGGGIYLTREYIERNSD